MKAITWPLALCAALACAWPSMGVAQQSSDDQARLHYQVAASYYEQADYESALREFLNAYRLSQRPQLLFNISLCYQQLGNLDEAIANLERYLAEVTEIENRPSLEQRLDNLRSRRDQQHAAEAAGASGGSEAGESGVVAPTPPPPSGGDETNVPAIVGFSIAGVGLVTAAILSGLTLAEDDRVSHLACAPSSSCSASDVSTLNTYALVADLSWGVSLAGAVVGTIFLFVPTGGGSSDTASIRVVPLAGTVNGLSISGAF